MRDNLPNMLRAAAKEWRKENKVVATGATRYDAALDEAADAIEELTAYVRQIEELRKDGYYLQKTKKMTYGQATMTQPLPEPPKEET